jgi:hypothetical protein
MKNRGIQNIFIGVASLLCIGTVFYPTTCGNITLRVITDFNEATFSGIRHSSLGNPPHEQWNSTYGGELNDQGKYVEQTIDEGYILVGQTGSYGSGEYDIWLIKTNALGVEQWNSTIGGSENDFGSSALQSTDGGYILVGSTYSYGAGNQDIWLIKTDTTGTVTWNRTFGGTDVDYGSFLQQTNDGGYILVGGTSSYGVGNTNVWLIKTDGNGQEIWNKTYGVTNKEASGAWVQQTDDGGYIITGRITTDMYPTLNVWLVKTDANGNKLWEKDFGDEFDEWGSCVQQTSDDGYIIAANKENDFWLIKTNSVGSEEWNTQYDHSQGLDRCFSVQETIEGGFVLTGYAYVSSLGDRIWLVKTDSNGNMQWDMIIGSMSAHGYCCHQTHDNGFIVLGEISGNLMDVYLIKIEPEGLPSAPTIQGQINGKKRTAYEYTFNAVDPNGDPVYYFIDWGDGTTENWIGSYPSGQTVKVNHTWVKKGTYIITAKAKDTNNHIGPKGTLEVTMPQNVPSLSIISQKLHGLYSFMILIASILQKHCANLRIHPLSASDILKTLDIIELRMETSNLQI